MANQNGQIILQALQNLNEPATETKIVTHIADAAGVHAEDVRQSVQETLHGGIRYGYIQRSNRKYFAAPVDLEGMDNEDASQLEGDGNKDSKDSKEDGAELEDRGGRRRGRRRVGRSRSRSRKASRRRRRSRR